MAASSALTSSIRPRNEVDSRQAPPRYVSYIRVSTAGQGRSGLGLEAQRAACKTFLDGVPGAELIREYVEVESGKRNNRPELAAAMAEAKLKGATLLIAKLDRLSRDAHFLIGLQRADLVGFVACDLPHANKLTVGIMALIAEQEREAISARTKAALAAARARGIRLGNPNGALKLAGLGNRAAVAAVRDNADAFAARVMPTVRELEAAGKTINGIAKELNAQRIPTARGGAWTARAVINLKARAAKA